MSSPARTAPASAAGPRSWSRNDSREARREAGVISRSAIKWLHAPLPPNEGLAMPLLDHFHPPVSERRSWEGFHGLWAAALVEKLNRDVLAEEYYADMQVHVGSAVEVDVATSTEMPPVTELVVPAVFPDDIEVQVFATA